MRVTICEDCNKIIKPEDDEYRITFVKIEVGKDEEAKSNYRTEKKRKAKQLCGEGGERYHVFD